MRRMASLNLLLPTSSFRIDPDEVIGQVHVSSQPSQQTSSIYYILLCNTICQRGGQMRRGRQRATQMISRRTQN